MRNRNEVLHQVLGPRGLVLASALHRVLSSLGTHRYSFMPEDEFERLIQSDRLQGNRVYWLEILYRAHFGSVAALLRCERWIGAIQDAVTAPNLLSFAAAYRGLVEAAADTMDSFLLAEATISEYYRPIADAVTGKLNAVFIVERLEDTLIHFMYARKLRGEVAPASHRAKETREYLDALRRMSGPRLLELYGELCNLTHPAGPGIMAYAIAHGDGSMFEYWPSADRARIAELTSRYADVAPDVLMAAINPPLVMLKVLNCFAQPALTTPAIDEIDLSGVPAWRKAQERMSKSSPVA